LRLSSSPQRNLCTKSLAPGDNRSSPISSSAFARSEVRHVHWTYPEFCV
jgi:hypothetical protein